MAVRIAPDARQQFFDNQGNVLSGGLLFFYAAGSATKQNTYTDSTGGVANSNPIILDADGRTPDGVWLTEGLAYKMVLCPANDTDPPTSPIWSEDNIRGINDALLAIDEWVASGFTPTYISGTSFSLAGDQTVAFHKSRRVKVTDAGGTKYGTIVGSAFAALTTITIALDGGATLANPTSAVSLSVLTAVNPGVSPDMIYKKGTAVASAATTDIWSIVGDFVHITGVVTITSLGTAPYAGDRREIIFDGALTLTHNATTLILPGGSNITTAAGDRAIVRADTTANMVVIAYTKASGAPAAPPGSLPKGRTTLTTAVPVTTADVTGATTVYYTPYIGNTVPIYNGSIFVDQTFAEVSQLTTDNTKSPAAVANNSNYDLFAWMDSGTFRVTRGPAWTSDTGRGTGAGTSELQMVLGINTNKVAITNGPGANLGTYLSTIRSDGSAQINDSITKRGVWNCFNRVRRALSVVDGTNTWTYTTATWRQANAAAGNQFDIVNGLNDTLLDVLVQVVALNTSAGVNIAAGVGIDVTNANSAQVFGSRTTASTSNQVLARYTGYAGLGKHTIAWLEVSDATGTTTWYGDNGSTFISSGMLATTDG